VDDLILNNQRFTISDLSAALELAVCE